MRSACRLGCDCLSAGNHTDPSCSRAHSSQGCFKYSKDFTTFEQHRVRPSRPASHRGLSSGLALTRPSSFAPARLRLHTSTRAQGLRARQPSDLGGRRRPSRGELLVAPRRHFASPLTRATLFPCSSIARISASLAVSALLPSTSLAETDPSSRSSPRTLHPVRLSASALTGAP